ncbi:Peptidoglycan/xylan/chitin deacetylase, PgdA/CDA1 family [Micromonospora pallida]|uniref:Peptidoglycan/xylan/chitin deacetylase, PgdA/CDA1 family n=1 Tax=Micromonospora pallida TaxID=145854 RepID=A0A1C6TFV8_9ACTN|nr:polysaccharide deacetylase family protein [Micromonospora pallida]SCL40343.1 Peptidoglycan/xylan/chitin deacetylase, PgdA/CDA1 family [Micromonospora pallida]
MRAASPPRALWIVALVTAGLLGSAYAIGYSLMGHQSTPDIAAPSDSPHQFANQPPATSAAPEGSPSPAGPTADNADQDGPFGTQMTTGTGQVTLTFDDGPDPNYTPQALAALRAYRVTATFCLVGENVQAHPDLVRAIVADGHTLCNHTWNHDVTLGSQSYESIRADLLRTNEAIRAAVPDARIAYYRQPGGAWTYPVVSVSRDLGMVPLHWTVDPADWETPGAASIAGMVNASTVPGSVVLLHDAGGDRQGTVDALYHILPNLTSRFQVAALPPDL